MLCVFSAYTLTKTFSGGEFFESTDRPTDGYFGRIYCGEQGHGQRRGQKLRISKSTVHKDVSKRLKSIDPKLYTEVKSVLDVNKAQRHIRGGLAQGKSI